jgi:hypothetical protein
MALFWENVLLLSLVLLYTWLALPLPQIRFHVLPKIQFQVLPLVSVPPGHSNVPVLSVCTQDCPCYAVTHLHKGGNHFTLPWVLSPSRIWPKKMDRKF